MALDGIFIHALTEELSKTLNNARLNKIRQPEKDRLDLVFRTNEGQKRILISVNPSLPLVTFSEGDAETPPVAPNFCMVMRKHLLNAKLLSVTQPGLERIIVFTFEHLDEMGDLAKKDLRVELMGKYSNAILTDEALTVIDALKRVPPTVSSVRTVLPGSSYFVPETQGKTDPFFADPDALLSGSEDEKLYRIFSKKLTGFSEPASIEFLTEGGFDPDDRLFRLSAEERQALKDLFRSFLLRIRTHAYSFEIALKNDTPVQFSAFPLSSFKAAPETYRVEKESSATALLNRYYREKAASEFKKRSADDLTRLVKTLLERAVKKQVLQEKQLADTEDRETNRLYGELLRANAYQLPAGEPVVTVENYYDGMKDVSIKVDPDLSIQDNATKYYEKYAKQKRTCEALVKQLDQTRSDVDHLTSVLLSLDLCEKQDDFAAIKKELADSGYLKRVSDRTSKVRKASPSKPMVFCSSDGFLIYVGRNNLQNDELTMKFAAPDDYFFHAKKAPGSHVILKTEGKDVPDRAFTEAASVAAYFSSQKDADKVEIDYVLRKHVKKPSGSKPGFVVYYTNYSMMASPSLENTERVG